MPFKCSELALCYIQCNSVQNHSYTNNVGIMSVVASEHVFYCE
jgi:hypothetical protein